MKFKIFTFFLFCLGFSAYSQSLKFEYGYDLSGNRVTRKVIYITPPGGASDPSAYRSADAADSTKNTSNDAGVMAIVFPNPTYGVLNVMIQNQGIHTYQLYSIEGKTISQGQLQSGANTTDLSGEGDGQYVLRITDGNGKTEEFKIIKKS